MTAMRVGICVSRIVKITKLTLHAIQVRNLVASSMVRKSSESITTSIILPGPAQEGKYRRQLISVHCELTCSKSECDHALATADGHWPRSTSVRYRRHASVQQTAKVQSQTIETPEVQNNGHEQCFARGHQQRPADSYDGAARQQIPCYLLCQIAE